MGNSFFGNNLSKLDKIKLKEMKEGYASQKDYEESENYPLGGMLEPYDIEKEKEFLRDSDNN